MQNAIDPLQIKIEETKKQLPDSIINAINAVPWQATIKKMEQKNGYNLDQLGDLETETQLLLYGLTAPEDYPGELEKRMGITKAQTDELINEMNQDVFVKIKEELIKNIERKEKIRKTEPNPIKSPTDLQDKPTTSGEQSILAQKISGSFQIPSVKTEHTLNNLTSNNTPNTAPKIDPYREIPE